MQQFIINNISWLMPTAVACLFAPMIRLFARVQKLETTAASKEDLMRLELELKDIRMETQKQIGQIALEVKELAGEVKAANASLAAVKHQLELITEIICNKVKP